MLAISLREYADTNTQLAVANIHPMARAPMVVETRAKYRAADLVPTRERINLLCHHLRHDIPSFQKLNSR